MIPYTIVRATQFYEFIGTIADASTAAGSVRLPPVRFQPMAAEDAARAAVGTPVNGIVEVGGPEQFRFDEIVRRVLAAGAARSASRRAAADGGLRLAARNPSRSGMRSIGVMCSRGGRR